MKIFEKLAQKDLDLAWNLLNQNKLKEANFHAKRSVNFNKNLEEGWLILAATGKIENRLFFLNKALEINPNNKRAKKGLEWAMGKMEMDPGQPSLLLQELINLRTSGNQEDIQTAALTGFDSGKKRNGGRVWQRITSRWQTYLALALILIIAATAFLAPILAPVNEPDGSKYFKIACDSHRCVPEPPNDEFPLGTVKEFDVFHTLVWGTRQSLVFGLSTAFLTSVLGTFLGAIAAYTGGWPDKLIMRICDALLAFPIIAAVALFAQIITLLSPSSPGLTLAQFEAIPEEFNFFQTIFLKTDPILLALILFSWMPYARIIHAQVLQVKQTEYIEAAKVVGARHRRIILKHILPNSLSPAIVMATRDIGRMVVIQSSLTFIGVGESSAWATILNTGKDWIIGPGGNLFTRWWVFIPITLAVVFFGVSWSVMGDEINHWLNPRNAS